MWDVRYREMIRNVENLRIGNSSMLEGSEAIFSDVQKYWV